MSFQLRNGSQMFTELATLPEIEGGSAEEITEHQRKMSDFCSPGLIFLTLHTNVAGNYSFDVSGDL